MFQQKIHTDVFYVLVYCFRSGNTHWCFFRVFCLGQVTDLKDVVVTQIALGKAHTVVLTDRGQVFTFGINNKGQCGRDFQPGGNKEGIYNFREDFFQLFNWFYLFFCEKEIPKFPGHSRNRFKLTFLKGGIDGFSYFQWFSVILFSIQNHI